MIRSNTDLLIFSRVSSLYDIMKLYTTKKAFARHARQQSGISFYYKGLVLIWKEKQEKKASDFKRHSGKESLVST